MKLVRPRTLRRPLGVQTHEPCYVCKRETRKQRTERRWVHTFGKQILADAPTQRELALKAYSGIEALCPQCVEIAEDAGILTYVYADIRVKYVA